MQSLTYTSNYQKGPLKLLAKAEWSQYLDSPRVNRGSSRYRGHINHTLPPSVRKTPYLSVHGYHGLITEFQRGVFFARPMTGIILRSLVILCSVFSDELSIFPFSGPDLAVPTSVDAGPVSCGLDVNPTHAFHTPRISSNKWNMIGLDPATFSCTNTALGVCLL